VSPAWLAEWSRKHPFGVALSCVADAMTMCPGTGLLSQMIERGGEPASCRWNERARGLVTLTVCGCELAAQSAVVAGAAEPGAPAWSSASRW
jgi:hypothetical protein